ncbi:MAG TPA: 5-methyltetrahydropteroyltriglutamate--homocysteine S-methyltransferase, partial [Candidatus Methylacidiphilales bacterium]|nr:5-methyltetrahydropteroyltriglutamate--homocysteine S-methyltransferase [Candidatus Methylacidiphilales bacterium]
MGSRILIHNLGYPRMGALRQLKKSLEAYWRGAETEADLHRIASGLRKTHWLEQEQAGVDLVPSNDFSFYDQMLDTSAMVGAVPARYQWKGPSVDLPTYFAMARGKTSGHESEETDACDCNHTGVHAMEMTKWFDTNYHYIVPEFHEGQTFSLASVKVINEFQEAFTLGIKTKPVLLGPLTFLKLGKVHGKEFDRYSLLPGLLKVYAEVLRRLASAKAEWIQFDEPALGLDLDARERALLRLAYDTLSKAAPQLKLLVATYFNKLGENLDAFAQLPVQALHIDVTRSGNEFAELAGKLRPGKILSLGVVDGRNIWRNDHQKSLEVIRQAIAVLGEDRVWIAPSCSLMFTPHSLRFEQKLNPEIKSWLAFAEEKLAELGELRAILAGKTEPLEANQKLVASRAKSSLIHRDSVKKRCEAVTANDLQRQSPFATRRQVQQDHLRLPGLPTTTIGSFPQTEDVRSTRAHFRKGKITPAEYDAFLEKETARVVKWQDEIGLDVLVHGEYERTDMVEYFGEKLSGFVFTENGWVQSYGSRCVKPPVIFGDVLRPEPLTVRWSKDASSLTERPMKGMLTGPITILQWSFVRDDIPESETAWQLALALRDEVCDLEAAGIRVVQVDEPALREGLPLRRAQWD